MQRFHHPGLEDTEGVVQAKFIHLWQETNGTWKVTRVISFDHHRCGEVMVGMARAGYRGRTLWTGNSNQIGVILPCNS